MKKKDFNEIKNKNVEQINKVVTDLEKETTNIRMEINQDKIKNVHSLREKRKDLARALTVLSAKVIEQTATKEAKNATK